MALANPLPRAAFFDDLPVADIAFTPDWSQERSKRGGGRTIYADLAPMLWMASIQTPPMTHAEALRYLALINSRAGSLKTVLLYDKRMPYPSSDPDGTLFGSATPLIGTVTDRITTAFTGFPNNYIIPAGTWFQVIWDTSRYYLGQFAEDAVANGSGAVSATEVTPPLPDGIATSAAVTVVKPAGKFRVMPGSASIAMSDTIHDTVAFEAEQTYEA